MPVRTLLFRFDTPRHLALVASLLVLMTLGGCAVLAPLPAPEREARVADATELVHQGDFHGAAAAWLALADRTRGNERNHFLLEAASAYRQVEDWTAALPVLEQVDRDEFSGEQSLRFAMLRAEADLALGRPQHALTMLRDPLSLPSAWQARGLELRARAEAALDQPLAAARSRVALDRLLSGYDRNQNRMQLLSLLEAMGPESLTAAASTMSTEDPLRPWLGEALAATGGALASPLPELGSPVGTVLPETGAAVTREGYKAPIRVALLLPASGPLAPAGAAVRAGFFVAYQASPNAGATSIQVYDSAGAFGATDAYRQAVAAGAEIVIGPLDPGAVSAVFSLPELPIPVFALNHSEQGLPPGGSASFALPPEAEAAQAAARMFRLGLHHAVVFAADADWAQRAMQAFRAQFASLGGTMLGSATLAPSTVNFAPAIQTLAPSIVADTGVFLALRPRQGRLLVPQLEIAGIRQPIFATSRIYGAEPNQGLDRDLNGVQFSDAPWLFDIQPGMPQRSELKQTMLTANGPAARLFAFGMDAWNLLPYLDWLREHPGDYLPGATGQLTMDSFGRVHRTPIWVHFVNGMALPMSGGLKADSGAF